MELLCALFELGFCLIEIFFELVAAVVTDRDPKAR